MTTYMTDIELYDMMKSDADYTVSGLAEYYYGTADKTAMRRAKHAIRQKLEKLVGKGLVSKTPHVRYENGWMRIYTTFRRLAR